MAKITSKNERWEPIRGAKSARGQRYAVSTLGRIVSYTEAPKEGSVLKAGITNGYETISFRVNGEQKTQLVHRLVATYHCKRPSKAHKYVIHLDHKKDSNHAKNLKWVTHEDQVKHINQDPAVIKMRKERGKLTEATVKRIKKDLAKSGSSLKQLGAKYGVSDMQIHRIKIGENWGHVKI